MLRLVWAFPLVAALVAFVFAGLLARRYAARRRPYQLLWALSLAMYGLASAAVALGVLDGWSRLDFQVYWGLGAVLNVPFLAAGEVILLTRNRTLHVGLYLLLVFLVAYVVSVLRTASVHEVALLEQLPSGKEVFGDGTPAHRLPQLVSYPSYLALVAGALWSAWRMRGRPELKDRFVGTLLIVAGATIVAAGATFAALGLIVGFILTLVLGIAAMFGGFLRASRSAPAPAPLSPA